jgi:hypothetical protein
MRKVLVGLCVAALALLPACSRNRTPNSLIDAAGYHVTDDTVYYLKAFPGKAFEISGADVASFQAFDQTYARDESNVYLDGAVLSGADAATFQPLDRPGLAKDAHHVYLRDVPISADPAHFELLDGELGKDGAAIEGADPTSYRVLNADFECSADAEHAYYRQTVIAGAESRTFPPGRAVTGCAETSITFAG